MSASCDGFGAAHTYPPGADPNLSTNSYMPAALWVGTNFGYLATWPERTHWQRGERPHISWHILKPLSEMCVFPSWPLTDPRWPPLANGAGQGTRRGGGKQHWAQPQALGAGQPCRAGGRQNWVLPQIGVLLPIAGGENPRRQVWQDTKAQIWSDSVSGPGLLASIQPLVNKSSWYTPCLERQRSSVPRLSLSAQSQCLQLVSPCYY